MATVIRTHIHTILPIMRQRLADITELPLAYINIVCTDDTPPANADQDLLLYPHSFLGVEGIWDRHDFRLQRHVQVTIRTRVELDEVGSNLELLTHQSLGHFAMESKVLDALQKWTPADEDLNHLTYEPIYFDSGRQPVVHKQRKGWAQSQIVFSVNYEQYVDQSEV